MNQEIPTDEVLARADQTTSAQKREDMYYDQGRLDERKAIIAVGERLVSPDFVISDSAKAGVKLLINAIKAKY